MRVVFNVGYNYLAKPKQAPSNQILQSCQYKYGLLLGIFNPMQVPYWMICGTYLITHEWILDGNTALIVFSLGSAAGSFLCLFLYAEFARYIQNKFTLSTRLINTAVAILFFGLAGYHLAKRVYLAVRVKQETTAYGVSDYGNSSSQRYDNRL